MQSYCTECGAPLVVKRPRKKFCSNRCKMKTFRRGQSARFDRLESLVNKLTGQNPHIAKDLFAQGSAAMPIERARLDRMIALMDAWLQRRDREIAEGTYYDDDCDEDLEEGNTFPVPTQAPFSDGAPERIHGEGKEDQVASPWGEKPKVPIPLEHL